MVLQGERQAVGMRHVRRVLEPRSRPPEFLRILYENAVMDHGHARRLDDDASLVETWPAEVNVERLPLARGQARVGERLVLSVDRVRLPVGVSGILIRIEYLHLVLSHQENAAVPTMLSFALPRRGGGPLDVKLYVAEAVGGVEVSTLGYRLHVSIADDPVGRLSCFRSPLAEIVPIEQDPGV